MRQLILGGLLALVSGSALAAGGVALDKADIDLTDKESLRNGAKVFVQYCNSCHGAAYLRFSRMAEDLGIDEATLEKELMWTTDKPGEQMKVAMGAAEGKKWFGTKVPDLTLVARSRGVDWLYTYLRTFYLDPSRPFGVNNKVFPDVGMPHVLWELQGFNRAEIETDASGRKHIKSLTTAIPGANSTAEYDQVVRDLVNFMAYAAEPVRVERERLGLWVVLFLIVFSFVAYLLKREYWRDVH